MTIQPGAVLGGYRLDRVLGAGGMGTVYLARHPSLPRWDAIKVLGAEYSADPEYRSRFTREADLAAALDHPNVVAVHTRGETDGQLWIAMQYVEGTDAAAALEHDPGSMTPARALRIVTEAGRGLDHAHRRGLLHRDVKPANFLLSSADGDAERVLLTDFGVAKSTADAVEITRTGKFVATIAYASPEQLEGHRLDHHADVYGLACAFFKLATGRNPFPGNQPGPVMMAHLFEPPPRVTELRPELPAAVDEVLAVAMAKHPEGRFHSCHEFTRALEAAMVQGVSPLATSTDRGFHTIPAGTTRTGKPDPATVPSASGVPPRNATATSRSEGAKPDRRRNRWIAAGVGAVILAAAAGTGAWAIRGDDPVAVPPGSTTTAAAPPHTTAEARQQNPAFAGKVIAAVDIIGEGGREGDVDLHLEPSPQAAFLEALGFTYNLNCRRAGDEPTPRPVTRDSQNPAELSDIRSGYILAVRSDAAAKGGGSQTNLPLSITLREAAVVVLDDPAAVEAFRHWTDASEQILLDKLVPALRRGVR
ncbi:serine/threonine-protein kinase [Nocardia sp. NPDC057668]|uniref:serine/threonine-protein kinase n=1 Tax=Nocardia sp. NPDC057668 TaxID=3346202 RepID=UPI0036701EBF